MTWSCEHCRNAVDDELGACWTCGAARDGTINPEFQYADSFEPALTSVRTLFSLGILLHVVTATCLILALYNPHTLDWAISAELTELTLVLGVAGLYAFAITFKLLFEIAVWVPTYTMYRWQKHFRQNHRSR